jgi:hypothetical protein
MSNTYRKKKNKTMPISITIALITGIFGIFTAILSFGPTWITTLNQNRIAPHDLPTATWPIFPLLQETLPATTTISPIASSELFLRSNDLWFPDNLDPSTASASPTGQLTPSTTSDIYFSFDLTNLSDSKWVKIENYILLRVDNVVPLPNNTRQNILRMPQTDIPTPVPDIGGSGSYSVFRLLAQGPLQKSDILISPPVPGSDYFFLEPGEVMGFGCVLNLTIPDSFYYITPGLVYSLQGQKGVFWMDTFKVISPNMPLFWDFQNGRWITSSP